MLLEKTIKTIQPLNPEHRSLAQARLNRLTKPIGSLGRLEELATHYVAISGEISPSRPKSIVFTLAADHGVAADGVSAYPSSVTAQMVHNFLSGGAAINVLARQFEAEVRIVDLGVASDLGHSLGLVVRKVGWGTKNFINGPAMSRDEALQSVETGIELVQDAYGEGIRIVATGEMGIGNTTPSAAITAVMTGQPVSQVTGKGTGIDEAALARKVSLIERALHFNQPHPHDPLDVLAKVGGFEIGGIVGVILGGSACHMPVVLDGFISGAAALLAVAMVPACREYLIASHVSAEPGHRAALDALRLCPLLDLNLRLGEGTGACLAIGLIQSSLRLLTEMATFEEAGVDDALPRQQEDV
jgi:nicotinate-nucleotide--dimethylbenzimidazole phosphoribosyltransferase